ncbi:hypothetical protein CPB85DRAFT_1566832 [Mucidula mucida]|nr:hypothetical protein CPB85DRAFT_1566832 [Mucidula mucida]
MSRIRAYVECIARCDRDPDIQGYAVRLSVFIANVCLGMRIRSERLKPNPIAILMTWSHDDVAESVYVIFMQVYTILLATTVLWLTNKRSNLYLRLGKSHKIICFLTLLMAIQWLILPVIIYGVPGYVFDEDPCSVHTLEQLLFYRALKTVQWLDYSVYLFPLFPFFYIVYTLRHMFDIAWEHQRHQKKVTPWRFFRFVQIAWTFVRSWTLSNWIVVTYSHEWMIFLLVSIASIPESDDKWDSLGFGQLLAATAAIQPLYEVCKLTIRRRHELWRTVAGYPRSFWNGVVFLVTGHRNSWKKILQEREDPEANAESLPLRKHKYSNSLSESNAEDTVCLVRPEYSRHQSSGSYSSMPYTGNSLTPDYHVFTQ